MIYGQLHAIRSFFRRSRSARFCTPGKKSALLILSAALLSSIASGQVPTTTALPYLVTYQFATIHVQPVVGAVPPAVSQSGFGSLLGGGFSALLLEPTASAATASAIATVHKLLMMKNENFAVKNVNQWNLDATEANTRLMANAVNCSNGFPAVKFNHHLIAADSTTCTLPEQEEAQEAEEELQTLTESEEASQEVMEAAEAAAEAAEAAATAAEVAAEATLDALDVIEGLLDAISLF